MNKNLKKSTRYLVHWETQSKNLLKNFCSLMEHQSLVDIIICCGNNAIQAHKLVLAANSPLFREEFEKNSAIEQILINGCDFTVIKNLVELMYCGQTIIYEENTKFLISMIKLLQMKQFENLFHNETGASTFEDIYLPKPQFLTTKPKYPEFNYPTTQQGSSTNNNNNKNNAQLRGNLANINKEQPQNSDATLRPPLNPLNNLNPINENKAANNNKSFKTNNNNNNNNNNRGGKKTLKQQAEQACVKEAQASRLALASLQKSIAATPQVNSFIIEDTCTETTVENFIPNTVVDSSVNPFMINNNNNYPNLVNSLFLPTVDANNVTNNNNNNNNNNNEQIDVVKNTLTTDKLKDILKSDVPSNVEVMYKDAQGNLIPVNEEVLQSLSTKYGIQYQIVDEDGTYSEMKELNIENTEEFAQSLNNNAPSTNNNKPIIEVGDFLNQTECTLSIANEKFCSMITPSGNDIEIPSLSVEEPSEPIKTEEELTFIPEMFFSELITNQVQNNNAEDETDDIFIEKVLE